jgi:ankyrin repeat protein
MKENNSIQTSQLSTRSNPEINSSVDRHGNTKLHVAAWQGRYNLVRSFLGQGVDLEVKNNYGHTPLHAAAQNGHTQIVKALLAYNANVNARDNSGNTPLQLAVSNGELQVAKYLMNKSSNLAAKDQDSLLLEAVKSQNIKLVQFIIDNHANLAVKDEGGNSLLQIAISDRYINMDLVKYLLQLPQKKVNFLEVKNVYGYDPLHISILNDNLDLVRLFVDAGANLEAKDDSGFTALHMATWYRRTEIMKYLVEQDADLEAKDDSGFTALHMATWCRHTEIMKYLVEQGADLEAKDSEGYTALDIALLNKTTEDIKIAKFLKLQAAARKHPSIGEVNPNLVSPRFFAVTPQIGHAPSNTSFPELDSSQINHRGVQTSDINAHFNGTVLLLRTLAGKFTPERFNSFFKQAADPNVLLIDDRAFDGHAIHAINNFDSKLDKMEERPGFNKTF